MKSNFNEIDEDIENALQQIILIICKDEDCNDPKNVVQGIASTSCSQNEKNVTVKENDSKDMDSVMSLMCRICYDDTLDEPIISICKWLCRNGTQILHREMVSRIEHKSVRSLPSQISNRTNHKIQCTRINLQMVKVLHIHIFDMLLFVYLLLRNVIANIQHCSKMELLEKISFKDCNISDLLLELNLSTTNLPTISPSNFILEMQHTTEARLDKIKSSFYKKKKGTEDLDILPNIIIFQNFREDCIYSVPLTVVNRNKYPCPVRFVLPPSPYISMLAPDSIVPAKLAPGMELQCIIQFKPEKNKDYFHKLIIVFSESEYSVPIIAIGPRPLLTFPDNILLCESPVRVESEKIIFVRNISSVPGIFNIQCNKPFEMTPASGILDSHSSMQFAIKFRPMDEGLYNDTILVRYDTGETLIIYVQAIAKSSNIYLNKNVIYFDDTFKSLKNQKLITICNDSDHIVHFTWKKFCSDIEDKIEGDKIKENFDIMRDIESRKTADLEHFDVVDKDTADIIYDRIYKDEIIDFDTNEQFLFSNNNFIIEPLEGEIWPNHHKEIVVIFFPQTVKNMSCKAYCQVSGKNERLPLELKGLSMGPKFKFNIMSIDLGVIYLFAQQAVQIIATNNGNIPGDIQYGCTEKYTACKVTCEPEALYIKPFEDGIFNLSVICNEEGSFVAEIVFMNSESEEKYKILLRGRVIYAKLSIVEKECSFGRISLGAEVEKQVTLVNETTIQIPFHAFIHPDGSIPAISYDSVSSLKDKSSLPTNPQEYTCSPTYGLVPANTKLIVFIKLITNQVRKLHTYFNVDSWSQASHRISIPLSHICLLPDLVCTPSDVNIRFCFLHYLCQRLIIIKNKSCLSGKIWLYTEQNPGIKVDADILQTNIEPYGSIEVSLNIVCTELGKQHSSLKFCLFGGEESIACNVECIGQGPVVMVTPEHLNFGKVECLTSVTKSINVFNDSPTKAEVTIILKKSYPWTISHSFLYLEPEENVNVQVTCCVYDISKFRGKIIFDVSNRSAMEVLVTAVGIGTSIEVVPPIAPFLNLGPQLTKTLFQTNLLFTNRGTRFHKIFVMTSKVFPSFKKNDSLPPPTRFSISPDIFCLKAGDSLEVTLTIRNNKEEEVQEEYFIHALIENMKRQVIIESTFLVNFVEPILYFSKRELNFRVDTIENKILKIDEDIVEIENITPLTLEMDIFVSPPFYIISPEKERNKLNTLYVRLVPTDKCYLELHFDSQTKQKVCFIVERRVEIYFRKHVRKEVLNLRGEVNYPSIKFYPENVHFYSISSNSCSFFEVEIRNVSPLPLNFQMEWRGEFTEITQPPSIPYPRKVHYVPAITEEPESAISSELTITEEKPSEMIILESMAKDIKQKKGKALKAAKAPKPKNKAADKGSKKGKDSKRARPLPIELIFLHYCIETMLMYHNIELNERILGPISKESLIEIPETNIVNLQKMKQNLFSPIDNFIEDITNYNIIKCLKDSPKAKVPLEEILHVVPTYGYLNPYESQVLTVSFHPNAKLAFRTKVACYISGGLTEILNVCGVCSEINYYLETTLIDFGKQLFNDTCIKPLHLINTGVVPFAFNVLIPGFGSCFTTRLLEVGWIEVSPTNKILEPQEETYIIIKYTPGLVGKFKETFELEIGELPPILITVIGNGALPQIYLNLMRAPPPMEYTAHCYNAITNLTTHFMDVECAKKIAALTNEIYIPDLSKEEKHALEKEGWTVISQYKTMPSKIDIELAIERLLASANIICNHTSLLNLSSSKMIKFPKIYASSYLLDFGYVVVDEIEHRTIEVVNYGPGGCQITIICGSDKTNGFIQAGFNIQPMEYKLAVGEIHPLYILFSPLAEMYPNRTTVIEHKVYLQVLHGLRIPVEIRATVTRPHIDISTHVLRFEKVFCGQCKIMNIIVINSGPVPCSYEASVVPSRHQTNEKAIYFLHDFKDTLQPNDGKSIDITFEPKENDIYNWKVIIDVEKCEKSQVVYLKGEGVLPALQIDKFNLNFPPCIPYEANNCLYFTIENPNEFPIEYYLTAFDKQILDEEKVIKMLCNYYANDKLYIPQRNPGDKLPDILFRFYEQQFTEFRESLAQQTAMESEDSEIQYRPSSTRTKKKARRVSAIQSHIDPFSNKTDDAIIKLFNEYVKNKVVDHISNDEQNPRCDPIADALEHSRTPYPIDPFKTKEGVLFIFYGAPSSDYLRAANKVGIYLRIPILNLDKIIIDALVYGSKLSSLRINEIINEAFDKANAKGNFIIDESLGPLQTLEDKIKFIKSKLEDKKSTTHIKEPTATKANLTRKSKRVDDHHDTFLSIPQDLLIDLMTTKFAEYKTAILIETLDNTFIRTPILSLLMLLQSVGNIKYIHGTILYCNQELYKLQVYNRRMEAIRQKETALIEKILKFDSLKNEEFDKLSVEELELYKTYYVARRREEYSHRLDALRLKKLIKKQKNKQRAAKQVLSTRISVNSQKTRRTTKSPAKESERSYKSAKGKKTNIDPTKIVLTPEEADIAIEMEKFDTINEAILHIFEHWNRKTCTVSQDYTPKGQIKPKKETKGPEKRSKSTAHILFEMHLMEDVIGIPTYLIKHCDETNQIIENLGTIIATDSAFQNATSSLFESSKKHMPPLINEQFSIAYKPLPRPKLKKSDMFVIASSGIDYDEELLVKTDTPGEEDSSKDDEAMSRSSKLSISRSYKATLTKKKKKKYRKSSLVDDSPDSRTLLQSGQKYYYKVTFCPKLVGSYNYNIGIEIAGCKTKYNLFCEGLCDIPRIDMSPSVLFPATIRERCNKNKYIKNVYVLKDDFYDFGHMLICKNPITDDRMSITDAYINLKNISTVNCDIELHLIEPTASFHLYPEKLFVTPDNLEILVVNACPLASGANNNLLAVTIKNNPRVEIIPLQCSGCNFSFEITPKKLIFERILLHHGATKPITLHNRSHISVYWQFTNVNAFNQYFTFEPKNGIIKPLCSAEVIIEYLAHAVEYISHKKLHIEITNECGPAKPLMTDYIELNAETCDLLVTCAKQINFGILKARKDHIYSYNFMNKGKYNITFELTPFKHDLQNDKTIAKMFRIDVLTGTLIPNKNFNLAILLNTYKAISIKDFPLLLCNLMDHVTKEILSTFIITVNVKTCYSVFNIYPSEEINFGAMLLGSRSIQKITIKNMGHLEFSFYVMFKKAYDTLQAELKKQAEAQAEQEKLKKARRKSKSRSKSNRSKSIRSKSISNSTKTTKSSKKSNKKSKKTEKSTATGKASKFGPSITSGVFTIRNSDGVIPPQGKVELEIDCFLHDLGEHKDYMIIFISETNARDRNGKIIKLKASGCLPSLKWDDHNFMFHEHFVVDTLQDFIKPKEMQEHCVYVKQNNSLYFNNVIINTTYSPSVQLFNNSLIEADVNIQTTGSTVFKVKTPKINIQPLSKISIEVDFTPPEITNYDGSLVIQTVMPVGTKSEVKKILLQGEGRVPEIKILQPTNDDEFKNIYHLAFSSTLINKISNKVLKFQNIGDFPCKVILEIYEDKSYFYSLVAEENTIPLQNCPEIDKTAHMNMILLKPEEIAEFNVLFKPAKTGLFNCEIRIHIVNNPFEMFTVYVTGECFAEDIFLENIPTHKLDNTIIDSINNVETQYCTSYMLDFGKIFVNDLQKSRFKIVNTSTTNTYKFVFRSPTKDTVFIPAIGHLSPSSNKDIFVTFVSEEPIVHKMLLMDCLISQIKYTGKVSSDIPWDERQKLIVWDDTNINSKLSLATEIHDMDGSSKIYDSCPEPEYDIIDDSIRRIPILFSVKVNYSSYETDVSNIKFRDTFIFEKTTFNFNIFNTGDVRLEINWNIIVQNYSKNIMPRSENTNPHENIKVALASPKKMTTLKNYKCPLTASESSGVHMPFHVNTQSVCIMPKHKQEITITFQPLEVYEYKARLLGSVKNLSPALKNINVEISAKSQIPCCHFDVEFTDFITSGRRLKYMKIYSYEIDENTKCVEFDCLGVGIQHSKSFNIINPTDEELSFTWNQIASYEMMSVPLFSCQPINGTILPGKISTTTFFVLPQSAGTFESAYVFKIPNYNTIINFLIVANVRESNVKVLTPHISLKPSVIGATVTDVIILKNLEDVSLAFKFKKKSIFSEGRKQFIVVEPISGMLLKKSETKIKISFTPSDIGVEEFLLKCSVDHLHDSLTVGVTTKCYEVEVLASFILPNGKKVILNPDIDNVINLEDMLPKQEDVIIFTIRNAGNVGFYYQWFYNKEVIERKFIINLSSFEGYIKMNTELNTSLKITALRNAVLKNYKLELQVRFGPKYRILLNGVVTNTSYKFSASEIDFGPCLIQNSNVCYNHKTLDFFNFGNGPLTLECNFLNNSYLSIDFKIKKVAPKSKEKINICFHPKKPNKYINEIFFNINNQKFKLFIYGEGVELDISVVNIEDKTVILGSPQIGNLVSKTVKVINKCPMVVKAVFNISDRLVAHTVSNTHFLEEPSKKRILDDDISPRKSKLEIKFDASAGNKKSKAISTGRKSIVKGGSDRKSVKGLKRSNPEVMSLKSRKSKKIEGGRNSIGATYANFEETQEQLLLREIIRDTITIVPTNPITMYPNKPTEFVINYLPTKKIPSFSEKIGVQVMETIKSVCIVKGACVGPIFYLDRTEISFGVVVLHCSRNTKLLLINDGDVSSKFKWSPVLDNTFSITPMEGYSIAGTTTSFVVDYHPNEIDIQSKISIELKLESIKTPLFLKLIGMCADIPESSGTIEFACQVRWQDKKPIFLTNASNRIWKIYPYIDCSYFTCPDLIIIKPRSTTACEVIYKPLKMTKDKNHKGTIFFKLPDGNALIYHLSGMAIPPDPISVIHLETPCKENFTHKLPLKNWLGIRQKFEVFTEDISFNDEINYYELMNHDFVDLMGNEERDYEWNFYGFKECLLEFRIIFRNAEKEYMHYQINLKVTKCNPLDVFNLSTSVRNTISQKIILINPLGEAITYRLNAASNTLLFNPTVTVMPHCEVQEDIKFKPLLCESTRTLLDASCSELGTYLYEFNLTGLPAGHEPTLFFTTELGKTVTATAKIENLARYKTSFSTIIENDDSFYVPRSITLLPNQSSNVTVTFNPYTIKKVSALLSISSSTAGEFIYPLNGSCTAPKPKGPFTIKATGATIIHFYNPFLVDYTFRYVFEPDIFSVYTTEEVIPTKSLTRINIKLNDKYTSDREINGKLIILPVPQLSENVKWTYYLKVMAT